MSRLDIYMLLGPEGTAYLSIQHYYVCCLLYPLDGSKIQ